MAGKPPISKEQARDNVEAIIRTFDRAGAMKVFAAGLEPSTNMTNSARAVYRAALYRLEKQE